MNMFSIDEQTLSQIALYLAERPYKEVMALIMALQHKVKPIVEPAPAERGAASPAPVTPQPEQVTPQE